MRTAFDFPKNLVGFVVGVTGRRTDRVETSVAARFRAGQPQTRVRTLADWQQPPAHRQREFNRVADNLRLVQLCHCLLLPFGMEADLNRTVRSLKFVVRQEPLKQVPHLTRVKQTLECRGTLGQFRKVVSTSTVDDRPRLNLEQTSGSPQVFAYVSDVMRGDRERFDQAGQLARKEVDP